MKHGLILLDADEIKKHLQQSCDITIFNTISSTNDYLKNKLATTPQICLAEQQTAGKGRFGRNWFSPFGCNIYLSCTWPFNKDIYALAGLSLVTSLAIVKALSNYTPNLKIKWPNDILYNDKKLAGVLIEVTAESHGISQAMIGIGLNVNMQDQTRASLSNILKQPQDRNQITGQLLKQLFYDLKQFENFGFTPFLDAWQQYDYLAGKKVTLINNNSSVTGVANGINAQGQLLLKHDNGLVVAYSSGDTSINCYINKTDALYFCK